ncbi:MAG: iron-sulfur cluster assembly accessory protein [Chloroflexota bacterium]|nr:iron-sulfur cluster assembly accessory protein [Chloroflexota bacterium]MXZ63079.1 iron-sulfur cluster assembly accessory protein [Chloroflexota bacterium]MYE32402.1 iron-sulfur cluster assembly accessory protein [Chloroflexota bacterium]
MAFTMTVTENAAQRLGLIINQQREDDTQGLRIFSRGGGCGCSGPSFAMGIDAPTAEDNVLDVHGVRIIVDPVTAPNLEGASIDYSEDDLMRKGFTIDAPNVQPAGEGGGACGCGHGGGH